MEHPFYICFAEPFGVHILVVYDSAWMFHKEIGKLLCLHISKSAH